MARIPDEQREELRRLYRTHVRAIYAFHGHRVGRDTAEDLTATTFERAMGAWSSFDATKGSERTWLLAIARNAQMDHFRRETRRPTVSADEHPLLLEQFGGTDDPGARIADAAAVRSWLAELSEREREVLALRYAGDLSAGEIADATGLTAANVHQIVSRALRRLRAHAEAQDDVTDSAARPPG